MESCFSRHAIFFAICYTTKLYRPCPDLIRRDDNPKRTRVFVIQSGVILVMDLFECAVEWRGKRALTVVRSLRSSRAVDGVAAVKRCWSSHACHPANPQRESFARLVHVTRVNRATIRPHPFKSGPRRGTNAQCKTCPLLLQSKFEPI